jgi:hypothetical protein
MAGAAPAPGGAPPVSEAAQLKAEADALLSARDYRAAADRYARAARLEPGDVAIRFGLGTAYTFLDRRSDAVAQFRAVIKDGDAGSVEYREAYRWLAGVGVRVDPEGAPAAAGSTAKASGEPAGPADKLVGGRLVGHTEWPGFDPRVRQISGEMWLFGAEPGTEDVKRSRPFRLGTRYHFYDIPPGKYRIVARTTAFAENVTLWDQAVMVEDGTPTELALTPATAKVSPDKFPPPPNG